MKNILTTIWKPQTQVNVQYIHMYIRVWDIWVLIHHSKILRHFFFLVLKRLISHSYIRVLTYVCACVGLHIHETSCTARVDRINWLLLSTGIVRGWFLKCLLFLFFVFVSVNLQGHANEIWKYYLFAMKPSFVYLLKLW